MDIIVSLPDDIARRLGNREHDLPRRVLEAFGLEEYRASRLTRSELHRVLGHVARDEFDGFLQARRADEAMSPAEFERTVLGVACCSLSAE